MKTQVWYHQTHISAWPLLEREGAAPITRDVLVCHSLCHSLLSPRCERHLLMLTLFRHQQASHELAGPVIIPPLSYQQDIKGNHRTEGNREIISGILLPCTWGEGSSPSRWNWQVGPSLPRSYPEVTLLPSGRRCLGGGYRIPGTYL